MGTRRVTVHLNDNDTWEDIVGPNIDKPRYVLCCGTILLVGGDLQSNTVDNDPTKNGKFDLIIAVVEIDIAQKSTRTNGQSRLSGPFQRKEMSPLRLIMCPDHII